MKKSRFTDSQIMDALKRAETGVAVCLKNTRRKVVGLSSPLERPISSTVT